jgi:alpha-glucosidase (family GH31 glycosyl hydrolase)
MKNLGLIVVLIFFQTFLFSQNNSVANQKSIIKVNNARFTILSEGLIRMEYSNKNKFIDEASQVIVNRNLPLVNFQQKINKKHLTIETNKFKLKYTLNSGEFNSSNLQIIVFRENKKDELWKPGTIDNQNLKGTSRTLDGYDGNQYVSNGSKLELEDGILSRSGWSFVDDSDSYLFDGTNWQWLKERADSTSLDYYFFAYDSNYKQGLKDFTNVAGKIPMIPRYAIGWWWSRYWAYSDKEIRELVKDIDSYNIPFDIMIIDMDWHEIFDLNAKEWKRDEFGQGIGWTGYSWNKNLFPNPKKLLSDLHAKDLNVALNLHPASGIYHKEIQYNDFAKSIDFDTSENKNIPYKMADKKWATTYFNTIIRPLENQGIDFWWLDWQQWKKSKLLKNLNNTWWLNYTFYSDMEKSYNNKRPMIFHRWGGLGNHRYPIGFSGDTYTSWESLAFQPYFTATASNVGYSYWSHDIGGHDNYGVSTDPELYLRWLQYGAFSPILRTHASKNSLVTREFWKFPNHFKMMKEALDLRYSLAPYLYNYMHEASKSGVSAIHPMYYEFPNDENSYKFDNQYYFGDNIIVSPITTAIDSVGLSYKKTWLPKGNWYNLTTGELIEGGKEIFRDYVLNEIPVFINTESIIPMYEGVKRLKDVPKELTLLVFPTNTSSFDLYEDDGISNDYKQNKFTKTRIVSKKTDNNLNIKIFSQKGSFKNAPKERFYTIRIPLTFMAKQIKLNGKNLDFSLKNKINSWYYDANNFEVVIKTLALSTAKDNTIDVTLGNDVSKVLSGKKSFFKRLETQVEILRFKSTEKDWVASLPNEILKINQTQSRIRYNPKAIVEEFSNFDLIIKKLHESINSVKSITDNQKKMSSVYLGLE